MFIPPRIELPPEPTPWSWSSSTFEVPTRFPVCAECGGTLRLKHKNGTGHDHAAQIVRPGVHVCPAPEPRGEPYLLVNHGPGFMLAAYFLTASAVAGFILGWLFR